MYLNKRNLLGLRDLTASDMREILHSAETMKYMLSQPLKRAPHLLGKSIVEIFTGESIRTKLSFELAAKYMSGTLSTVNVPENSKRERILDIATAVDRMGADAIIIRNPRSGVANLISRHVNATVINAGDGMNEHPTQALVDIFTIVGDILHSGIARSNIWGLTCLGANVAVGAPETLVPTGLRELGVSVYNTPQEAMHDADVVMSVSLKHRGSGIMYPDTREYANYFGIDEERIKFAKEDALIMHALPVRRGVELMSCVMDCENSMLNEQVTNGVAVKMAVLHLYVRRAGGKTIL
ncbi:MAG: aspartate carbamoyltransferase [Clostridia bacterium]